MWPTGRKAQVSAIPGHGVRGRGEPAAVTLPVRVMDPEDLGRLSAWRGRGVDEETATFCLMMRRLERIIIANRDRRRHVLIACMPKSASTFLRTVLVEATGFESYLLNTAGSDTERNIDARSIPMFLSRDTVSQ